jgi:hypothetical protein
LTERWHHQLQIRDAVGASPLADTRILQPVLATFARAIPWTFRTVDCLQGTAVTLLVSGDSGNAWSIVRESDAWRL